MQSGVVMGFNNDSFGRFFSNHNIDIHGNKYQDYGESKAKKMRCFWDKESDAMVAKVLSEMLNMYKAECEINKREVDVDLLRMCRGIVSKLSGIQPEITVTDESDFLRREFSLPPINKLPVDSVVADIIEKRLEEVRKVMGVGAYLSVIFLCGSILEGVLLGVASNNSGRFNESQSGPKDSNGKVRPLHKWSCAHLLDAACELRILPPDIGKFGHGLRQFRNYIHPYQQMSEEFSPDEHTAKICFQVLKAALASLAGNR